MKTLLFLAALVAAPATAPMPLAALPSAGDETKDTIPDHVLDQLLAYADKVFEIEEPGGAAEAYEKGSLSIAALPKPGSYVMKYISCIVTIDDLF